MCLPANIKKEIMDFYHIKTPLNKYTFKMKPIRSWVESQCKGVVLNLFAGNTKLNVAEIRNDIDPDMPADAHTDALTFVRNWKREKFDTIILDPPYSYRKSMEFYNGNIMSPFKKLKDEIPNILNEKGIVITFGYQSISMGKNRGFKLNGIAIFCHGGAIHDTIASVEEKI